MEYQKKANLLDITSNQASKFRTRKWVEINDDSKGTYANSNIKFKSTMLKSNLCDYEDAYILAKGTITIARNSTTLVNSLMNITIDLKFIFIIDASREYNSHGQDITS